LKNINSYGRISRFLKIKKTGHAAWGEPPPVCRCLLLTSLKY
jgi:hypothetical protein